MQTHLFLLQLTIALFSYNSYSQSLDWAIGMGSTDTDFGYDIAVDQQGNVYTVGMFNGTVDFDAGAQTYDLAANGSNTALFIQKVDADGNFVWANRIRCSFDMQAFSIALDADGNVYTTGHFTGTCDFDPSPSSLLMAAVGDRDAFILKYTTDGELAWIKTIGGVNDDIGRSLSVDDAGNLYVTGTFTGTIDIDPGTNTTNLTATGLLSAYILKLDANGDFVWGKMNSGASAGMQPFSIKADGAGNIFLAGGFLGTMDFDPSAATYTLTSTSNTYDIFVQKLNAAGNLSWVKSVGSTNTDYCHSVSLGGLNDIYLTGFFNSTVDFDPSNGISNLTSAGGNDVFILKLDTSGNFGWAKRMGSTGSDMGQEVFYRSGQICSVGSFYNTVDLNPNAGTQSFTAIGTYPDAYIQVLDTTGVYVWSAAFGSDNRDEAFGVYVDQFENKYLTGRFNGTVDFDPTNATVNLMASTGTLGDIFVQKLSSPVTAVNTDAGSDIGIYPNPASSQITISGYTPASLKLCNTLGQTVAEASNTNMLLLGNLPQGLYVLQVFDAKGQQVRIEKVLVAQ